MIGPISHGLPKRCVTIIPFVRSLILAATVSAVTLSVFGSTSAKTGTTPRYISGVKAPMSVIEVVMISSPGSGLIAATAMWIAAEPEVQAYANFAPSFSANFCSSILPNLPFVVVKVPLFRTSVT